MTTKSSKGKRDGVLAMPVMIVDGIQYSARMVVKQYENKGHVLDELSLYNMAMHKEKAPSHTNLSASERGGAQYEGAVSGYKVKDLIHNTQAGDRKLLGLDEKVGRVSRCQTMLS